MGLFGTRFPHPACYGHRKLGCGSHEPGVSSTVGLLRKSTREELERTKEGASCILVYKCQSSETHLEILGTADSLWAINRWAHSHGVSPIHYAAS